MRYQASSQHLVFEITNSGCRYYYRKSIGVSGQASVLRHLLMTNKNYSLPGERCVSRRLDFSVERDLQALAPLLALHSQRGNAQVTIGSCSSDPAFNYARIGYLRQILALLQKQRIGQISLVTASEQIVLCVGDLLPLKPRLKLFFNIETNDYRKIKLFSGSKVPARKRLKTAQSLRVFGFDVNLCVLPALPLRSAQASPQAAGQALQEFAADLMRSGGSVFLTGTDYLSLAQNYSQLPTLRPDLVSRLSTLGYSPQYLQQYQSSLIKLLKKIDSDRLLLTKNFFFADLVGEQIPLFQVNS